MAREFTTTTDQVAFTSDAGLNITGDITIYAWIYLNAGAVYHELVAKMATNRGTDVPYLFRTTNANPPVLFFSRAHASAPASASSTGTISIGAWHWVCVTHDGTTATFYIDDPATADSSPGLNLIPTTTTDDMTIGEGEGNLGGNCRIAWVGIHTAVLGADDRATAKNEGVVSTSGILGCQLGSDPEPDTLGSRSGTVTGSTVIDGPPGVPAGAPPSPTIIGVLSSGLRW
jgi:hypothetical protein